MGRFGITLFTSTCRVELDSFLRPQQWPNNVQGFPQTFRPTGVHLDVPKNQVLHAKRAPVLTVRGVVEIVRKKLHRINTLISRTKKNSPLHRPQVRRRRFSRLLSLSLSLSGVGGGGRNLRVEASRIRFSFCSRFEGFEWQIRGELIKLSLKVESTTDLKEPLKKKNHTNINQREPGRFQARGRRMLKGPIYFYWRGDINSVESGAGTYVV